ncbi:MAG: YkgJ family cysteine cluster protein [Syntrophaceae bacterium]|nr:YkgJ family cysteine cluster protein [Syntrophaceae bacterium]
MEIQFPGLDQLSEVYADLDRQVSGFKRRAGIECLRRCTYCCATAKFVEASIFEMLPLSLHLWQEGRAEALWKNLEGIHPEEPCVLLQANPPEGLSGGCSYYRFRPLVCRLFGFAATLDKHGNPRVGICRPLKEMDKHMSDRIDERVRGGLPVPLMPDFSRRVAFLHPHFGQEKYPINLALREALEIVGRRIHFLNSKRRDR